MSADIYQQVTDKLLEQMEQGGKWSRPWTTIGLCGTPYNGQSENRYNGINVLVLGIQGAMEGYATSEWRTYKQWQEAGAQVRKGESGTRGVFYSNVTKNKGKDDESTYFLAKGFTVFNADQVEGYDPVIPELPSVAERIHSAEQFIIRTGAQVNHGGDKAFYMPSRDRIQLPMIDQFRDSESYYATALHELVHWTGAKSRLDRDLNNRFGDARYAAEELIAETGAAMLCATLGISAEPREDHARYLNSWLQVLRADKKAIFTAAGAAQKAANYLHSLQELESLAA